MIGTLVRTTCESVGFYKSGALARLVFEDAEGDWWAEFANCGNASGTYLDLYEAVWCVGFDWDVVEVVAEG